MDKKQQNETKRLPGFYIALCCCVLAIGVAGYFTERHEQMKESEVSAPAVVDEDAIFTAEELLPTPYTDEEMLPTENTAEKPMQSITQLPPDEADEQSDTAVSAAVVYDENTETIDYDNPDLQEAAFIVTAEETVFQMPVNGRVLEDYSEELSYNRALGDWRTHDGIDISCDVGCSVNAAAAGMIETVTDDAYGTSVTISHDNGYKTVYRQLAGAENIKQGSEVSAGDVIGTAGESRGENITEPHIHFEVYKDGKCIDPKSMF